MARTKLEAQARIMLAHKIRTFMQWATISLGVLVILIVALELILGIVLPLWIIKLLCPLIPATPVVWFLSHVYYTGIEDLYMIRRNIREGRPPYTSNNPRGGGWD